MAKEPTAETLLSLFPEIEWIEDTGLREKVVAVWLQLWQASRWQDLEALPVSGLLPQHSHIRHNRSVIHMARHTADMFERFYDVQCDRDVLYAAALLQDASKLLEYEPGSDGKPVKTEIGSALEHPLLAVHEMLNAGLPLSVTETVWHHNPEARRFPARIEGLILYYCDQLDLVALEGHRWKRQITTFR